MQRVSNATYHIFSSVYILYSIHGWPTWDAFRAPLRNVGTVVVFLLGKLSSWRASLPYTYFSSGCGALAIPLQCRKDKTVRRKSSEGVYACLLCLQKLLYTFRLDKTVTFNQLAPALYGWLTLLGFIYRATGDWDWYLRRYAPLAWWDASVVRNASTRLARETSRSDGFYCDEGLTSFSREARDLWLQPITGESILLLTLTIDNVTNGW